MENEHKHTGIRKALIFSIEDKVGGLKEALDLIMAHKLNMVCLFV
jgi:prephenate dehydratase